MVDECLVAHSSGPHTLIVPLDCPLVAKFVFLGPFLHEILMNILLLRLLGGRATAQIGPNNSELRRLCKLLSLRGIGYLLSGSVHPDARFFCLTQGAQFKGRESVEEVGSPRHVD